MVEKVFWRAALTFGLVSRALGLGRVQARLQLCNNNNKFISRLGGS